jgi:hypothetical protein
MRQHEAEDEFKLKVAALIRELEHKQVERVAHQLLSQPSASAVSLSGRPAAVYLTTRPWPTLPQARQHRQYHQRSNQSSRPSH